MQSNPNLAGAYMNHPLKERSPKYAFPYGTFIILLCK